MSATSISRVNLFHGKTKIRKPALLVRATKTKHLVAGVASYPRVPRLSQSGSGGSLSSVPQGLLWVSLLLVLLFCGSSFASGSAEKTPEQKAAAVEKTAFDHYNNGVEAMNKAKEIGRRGDSTFAFNYRATSDAKAKKQFEKAAVEFEDAGKRDPKMKEAFNNLGYCYRKLDKLKESLAAYERAIAIDPNFAQAREYRGETFLALMQPDKANEELKFLSDMKSPYADSLTRAIELFELTQIKAKMGK